MISSFFSTWRITFACMAMCASALTTVSAQGMAADYERAEKFAGRIQGAYVETTVSPHWLPSNDAFWYRKDSSPKKFDFVFVDAKNGIRRPAFDHIRLAEALSAQGTKAEPASLPFTWIDPARNGSVVRFRVSDKTWEFGLDGKLSPYSGDLNEEKLQPLPFEFPSRSSSESTSITFINRGKTPLSLFWIDSDGEAVAYGTVEVGKPFRRQTYVGHVWRLSNPTTGGIVASYIASANEAQAIIEDTKESFTKVDRFVTEPHNAPAPTIELADHSEATLPTFARNGSLPRRAVDISEARNSTDQFPLRAKNYPSPDSRLFVKYQTTPEQEHTVYMVESSPKDQVQPKLKTNKQYLKPGDKIAIDRPRLYASSSREISTDESLFSNPWSIDHMGWSPDGTEYRFLYNQRGHQILRIIGINQEGVVRVIHEDKQKTFIDYSSKTYSHAIKGKDELIWASERDGWNHLYLIDMKTGTIKNQITKGNWVMRSVDKVDDAKQQIWFKGFGMVPGQDPYYAHLARINFDGTGLTILTEGDGTHSWKWSPDRTYFTDTWSRVDQAPRSVLRNAETGKPITDLEAGDLKSLLAVDWTPPERFVALGRDGKTEIHGIIIKPSNFDPAKKYPIIEQIYAGPQDFFVPKAFSTLTRQHEYAELGFILVQIDGMGTNWRSKSFHDTCFKNLKDAGFPDRIAWMKAAQQTRPWMDLSRVGIYGGSAGGQNAMGALLFHPEFYTAAAADSGCHDNRMDKIWWNEAWMGHPVDQSYIDSSNVVNAKNLIGALMLIVPELDTNVDPASTMQVVNALTIAKKDFELIVVPGANHGAGSSAYGIRRQRDFFVKELLGVQPPKRNKPVA